MTALVDTGSDVTLASKQFCVEHNIEIATNTALSTLIQAAGHEVPIIGYAWVQFGFTQENIDSGSEHIRDFRRMSFQHRARN